MHSIERMGDQCVNIAKVIPLTGHDAPQRAEMLERILRMGKQARSMISQAKKAFEARDVELARDLVRQDDLIDDLNKECFQIAVEVGEDKDMREWAMTMMLVARAIERIGDNAVDIGEQVAFVVTGPLPGVRGRLAPGRDPGAGRLASGCRSAIRGRIRAALRISVDVLCAAIDIGSNTTRLLVAEPQDGQLRKVMEQRAYTRIGKGAKKNGKITAEKIAEVAEVVATQVRLAEELGAEVIKIVATAAIREAKNRDKVVKAIEKEAGLEVEVLSEEDEGRLAFLGRDQVARPPGRGHDRGRRRRRRLLGGDLRHARRGGRPRSAP